jgi:small GTP-binding protein
MAKEFQYDVFLSHSSKDKTVVREIATRLKKDGIRVWFDDWVLKAGDNIPAKIEEGLEHSRVLVLCMSAHAFGSDWAQLESGTFRFRDPLNKERRFIPLRLDDAPIKGSLGQFLYINWLPAEREQAYAKLLEACQSSMRPSEPNAETKSVAGRIVQLEPEVEFAAHAFSADGTRVLSASRNHTLRLSDLETGNVLREFKDHSGQVLAAAWSPDQRYALSGSFDKTVRLWDVETRECVRLFEGHGHHVNSVAWSSDGVLAISGSNDRTVRLWEIVTGKCLHTFEGHASHIWAVIWHSDYQSIFSGSADNTVRHWDAKTGRCLKVLEGHTETVFGLACSPDGRFLLSASKDKTLRLWEIETGRCLRILEGHSNRIRTVAWAPNGNLAVSGGADKQMRLWDLNTGVCLRVLTGHSFYIWGLAWSGDGRRVFSGDRRGCIRVWDLSEFAIEAQAPKITTLNLPMVPEQVQYTNAKVLIVGETSAGKTGLSHRLATGEWKPSDGSTVGAWATQWKLPVTSGEGVEREIWLWDFGGQADQRLIHQLYMDETALAVLVFDGQKDDLFETLGQWDRDLTRASRKEFAKLLVAGRVDASVVRVSRSQIESFKKERGYLDFLETSAKTGLRCDELKQAILKGIRWEDIPWRSSPLLFKRLKEEIIKLKDAGRVLMRFNELREALQLRLSGELTRFTDDELKAVVGLLSGPGVVWELKFGSWVLLQPGRINAYAQAVIQTMRADEHERGCLAEERVLGGDLTYHRPEERLPADEERFVLLAMHKILVERGLCLREHTDTGTMLIFPSYYRRERPELVGHPAALVSYRFNGFLDEIYATLVVRLHHTKPFEQDQLWRYAADFKTLTGKQLGVKLERRAEGAGELVVYADPAIADAEKIIFSRYVHEHILQKGRDMVRLRHYCCPHCGTPVGNREVAMERLNAWLANQPAELGLAGKIKTAKSKPEEPTILCAKCEKRVPLWDELEQYFASGEVKERVRQLQAESDLVLDNESKDRALVGDVISTVALAGQIIEEYSAKRYGLDMEIEFKDDEGKPTAKKLYLQLKSGDSHLRIRASDGAKIFQIHHEDHAKYWMNQAYPVFLVIGDSEGEVRWMEIRDYLKRESDSGKKIVKQIVFTGERFDVMSVRRWREKVFSVAG